VSQATDRLAAIVTRRAAGERRGIASICSAHPLVIEAALRHGQARGADVLIEATCNQVNHEGGYTGMTPGDFRRFVEAIAGKVAFPLDRLVLGGDHLGPNPWKHLPAPEAMQKASRMVEAYAEAGFTKIHLDASMGCAGEGAAPRRNWPRWPRPRPNERAAPNLSTSSARKCRCLAVPSRRWTIWR
jgi:D-tagatose-1,6-bisphosphate aldolase subunit GatZ/KbaZ